jgi:hypothetical protein
MYTIGAVNNQCAGDDVPVQIGQTVWGPSYEHYDTRYDISRSHGDMQDTTQG